MGNPMRERRRSAAMCLHDRPVAPVRLRFPRADVIRHTACQPAGHSVDCGRRAPKRVRDGSGGRQVGHVSGDPLLRPGLLLTAKRSRDHRTVHSRPGRQSRLGQSPRRQPPHERRRKQSSVSKRDSPGNEINAQNRTEATRGHDAAPDVSEQPRTPRDTK